MAIRIFLPVIFLFLTLQADGQTNPLDRKLERAQTLFKQQKLSDADDYLQKLMDENPEYGDGWDLWMQVRYGLYEEAKQTDNIFSNITVTTKDSKGKNVVVKDDSLAQSLQKMLAEFTPSKSAYKKFLYTLRKGTLSSRDAQMCSAYLRMLEVDVNVDSNVSKKALSYFNNAETEFGAKNYNKAAQLYKRAIEFQPDFYKARLYLGDSYYASGYFTEALEVFKEAVKTYPDLLEPRKYLVDAYMHIHSYEKAVDEAVNSFLVYPDLTMYDKVEDAAYMNHQKLSLLWMPRGVLPNSYSEKFASDSTMSADTKVSEAWRSYRAALKTIKPFCNKEGMIAKDNPLTKSPYLEVFSWEEMLKNSNDPSLQDARRMQQLGYLDCYVFISCFHHDFYPQYRHFAANNKERIKDYFKLVLTSKI